MAAIAVLPSLRLRRHAVRANMFHDTCVRALPTVDASRTLLGALCGRADDAAFNARVLQATRRLSPAVHFLGAVYYVAVVVLFVHGDKSTRGVASHVCGSLGLLFLFYLLATLAWDMVRLLLATFEFWFLFAVNAFNVALWRAVIVDERRAGLFVIGACYAASLLADANVATRPFFMRVLAVGAVILSVMLALLTLHLLPSATYPTYRLWDLEIEAVDLLLTGSFIIAFFSTTRVHRSRHLIFASIGSAAAKRVACEMYFPVCHLMPASAATATPKDAPQHSPCSASITNSEMSNGQRRRALQLVQSDASRGIDVHDVLVPAVANALLGSSSPPWTRVLLLNSLGLVGLVGTALSTSLRLLQVATGPGPSRHTYLVVDVVSFLATALFVLTYAAHAQRTLAARVALELDAWFVLLQISLITAGVSDALRWDPTRVLFAWSVWLWCVWVLWLDAVPPVTRRVLGLSRRVVLLAVMLLLAHPPLVGYWLYLSPARRLLHNRELVRIPLGTGDASTRGDAPRDLLRVDVLGFLASKLFTHFVWMGRFLWRELVRPRDAFKLLKRRVFYEGDSEH